jgi:hypothetical protein
MGKQRTLALALLAVAVLLLSVGCGSMVSDERRARRRYVIQKDLDSMMNDIDWVLGLDSPSGLTQDRFR